jgi:hypothetical protein
MPPKRFALLVGINYIGTRNELNGCINDVMSVRDFLIKKQKFDPANIVMLTDARNIDQNYMYTSASPTRENMIRYLTMAISQLSSGDYFYFHYSGHGSQVADRNGDESDRLDEALVPLDFQSNGLLTDDVVNSLIARAPSSSNITIVIDACHSATAVDLRWIYDPITRREAEKRGFDRMIRGERTVKVNTLLTEDKKALETKANVVCLSGCLDNQTSADAYVDGRYQGALTAAFLDVLGRTGNVQIDTLPIACRTFIAAKALGPQIPRLTFGRSDFKLTKKLF